MYVCYSHKSGCNCEYCIFVSLALGHVIRSAAVIVYYLQLNHE